MENTSSVLSFLTSMPKQEQLMSQPQQVDASTPLMLQGANQTTGNQVQAELMKGIVPPMQNQLPSTQASQIETDQAARNNIANINKSIGQADVFQGLSQSQEPSSQEAIDKVLAVTGNSSGFVESKIPPTGDKYAQDRLKGLQDVVAAQKKTISDKVSVLPFMKNDKQAKDLTSAWEKSLMDVAEATKNGQHDLAVQKGKEADDYMNKLNQLADMEKNTTDSFLKNLNEIDEHVNSTRLWDNMPLSNKLVAAASLFVGAFSNESKNRALETLQGEIDKDIQNQKLEYNRKGEKAKNAYAIAAKYYDNEKARLNLAHAITLESLNAKANDLEASMMPLKAKNAIEELKMRLAMAAQNSSNLTLKDLLDIQKTQLEIKQKQLDYADSVREKEMFSPEGEKLGRARSSIEARESREILTSYTTAIQSLDDNIDKVKVTSRLAKFNPLSKDWSALRASGVKTVLAYATLHGKANKLPVAEVNENKKEMEKQITEMWRRGPDAVILYLEGLKDHSHDLVSNLLQWQTLGVPKNISNPPTSTKR